MYALVLLNMSVSSVYSMNYEGSLVSGEGSDDEGKENEDKDTGKARYRRLGWPLTSSSL